MEILNTTNFIGSHRQFGIDNQTAKSIQKALGVQVLDRGPDDDKVTHCWDFTADGVECSIWDFKGSAKFKHWSFYGPREVAVNLFGEANVSKGVY